MALQKLRPNEGGFGDLPPELRDDIYKIVFEGALLEVDHDRVTGRIVAKFIGISRAVVSTCKLIRAEASCRLADLTRTGSEEVVLLALANSNDPAYVQIFQKLQTFVQNLCWIEGSFLCSSTTSVSLGSFRNLRVLKVPFQAFGCCIRRVLGPRADGVSITDQIQRVWGTNNRLCHGLIRRVESIEVEQLRSRPDWFIVTLKLLPHRASRMAVNYALPGAPDDRDAGNRSNDSTYRS
jgi:hypothetical protein